MAKGKVTGGDKMGKYLSNIDANLSKATSVDIGFLKNSTYPDGASVPMVAAIHEYGAPGARFPIPPRPFFRPMIKANASIWPKEMAKLFKANKYDAAKTLDMMGAEVKGELQQSIISTNSPPLSPVTLMLRAMVGPNGKATSILQVFEAIKLVQSGATPASYLKSIGKKIKKGKPAVAGKPLVWTGHLLNSVDYNVR